TTGDREETGRTIKPDSTLTPTPPQQHNGQQDQRIPQTMREAVKSL
ncbi:hypothetical protein ABIA35_009806, partial [Catenulispora sp. MAP12-49]